MKISSFRAITFSATSKIDNVSFSPKGLSTPNVGKHNAFEPLRVVGEPRSTGFVNRRYNAWRYTARVCNPQGQHRLVSTHFEFDGSLPESGVGFRLSEVLEVMENQVQNRHGSLSRSLTNPNTEGRILCSLV